MSKTIKVTGQQGSLTGTIYVGYSLFEGKSDGDTCMLSDSAANYKYIDFYYCDYDGYYNNTRVYSPNGKSFICQSVWISANSGFYVKFSRHTINEKTITKNAFGEMSGTTINYNNQSHYFTKIIGYK